MYRIAVQGNEAGRIFLRYRENPRGAHVPADYHSGCLFLARELIGHYAILIREPLRGDFGKPPSRERGY